MTFASSMMAAKEEVMTTRRTEGAKRVMALRMPVVPLTAGEINSFWGSSAHRISIHTIRLRRLLGGKGTY